MLDFYLIHDEQPKPNYPEQENLEFAGGIDHETYERLTNKGIIDPRFDYYSDFRWDSQMVIQILNSVNIGSNSDPQILDSILGKAKERKSGLIAYCD